MKELIVKNVAFKFEFIEDINLWRISENSNLIEGSVIDLEIDLGNHNNSLDWSKVEDFIKYIMTHNDVYKDRIIRSKEVLKSLFSSIYIDTYNLNFLDNIDFNLVSINYKGNCDNVNLKDEYIFDFQFYPASVSDSYKDLGAFVWEANFRNIQLLGVYCDML